MSANLSWATDAYASVNPSPDHRMLRLPPALKLTHIPHVATVPQTWPAVFDGNHDTLSISISSSPSSSTSDSTSIATFTSTTETSPYGGSNHSGTVRPFQPPQLYLTNLPPHHDASAPDYSIILKVTSLTFPAPHGTVHVSRAPLNGRTQRIKDLAEAAVQGNAIGSVIQPDADSGAKGFTTFTVDGLRMLNDRGWDAHTQECFGKAARPVGVRVEVVLRWKTPGLTYGTLEVWSGEIDLEYRGADGAGGGT